MATEPATSTGTLSEAAPQHTPRRIDEYLREVLVKGGSDLHFVAGDPPRIRLHGELQSLREAKLRQGRRDGDAAGGHDPARAVRSSSRRTAPTSPTRFPASRASASTCSATSAASAACSAPSRRKALTLEQLNLPESVRSLCRVNNGLILVTGKTGSGKSTTLAAMIDDVNHREKGHILTIEDPIEFVHPRKNCLVSQREVGLHSPSFAEALHSALREDPDIVLVGELRDLETMSIAVTAAEMGILVMGTLHTNGAAATVDRIVNAFPSDKQGHVRTMLSTSLRGVISQQLIQRTDKRGRVAALEILINTPAVSNLIRQGKLDQLENAMQSGASHGMRVMDSAVQELFDKGVITGRAAYEKAINKPRFEQFKDLG